MVPKSPSGQACQISASSASVGVRSRGSPCGALLVLANGFALAMPSRMAQAEEARATRARIVASTRATLVGKIAQQDRSAALIDGADRPPMQRRAMRQEMPFDFFITARLQFVTLVRQVTRQQAPNVSATSALAERFSAAGLLPSRTAASTSLAAARAFAAVSGRRAHVILWERPPRSYCTTHERAPPYTRTPKPPRSSSKKSYRRRRLATAVLGRCVSELHGFSSVQDWGSKAVSGRLWVGFLCLPVPSFAIFGLRVYGLFEGLYKLLHPPAP